MRQTPPAQPDPGADGYAAGAPEEIDAVEAPPLDDDEDDEDDDGLVQVEHEGKTYAVPSALKGALMRHADYTRKTQALAQQRQALQAGHQALQQAAETHGEHMADCARLVALGDQIAHLQQQNWPALHQQNPAAAQQLLTQLFQMKQAHEIAAGHLAHRQQVQAFNQQRQRAMQVEHGKAQLAQHIEGWSPEYAAKLGQFAMSQGLTPQEVSSVSDPRLVVLLHHAYRGHQADQQQTAGQKLAQAQAVRPAIQVGGGGSAPQDPNRMSTDDWIRHRRGQLRKKVR
jgi:hypothetical protein